MKKKKGFDFSNLWGRFFGRLSQLKQKCKIICNFLSFYLFIYFFWGGGGWVILSRLNEPSDRWQSMGAYMCYEVFESIFLLLLIQPYIIRPLKLDFVCRVTRPRYKNSAAFDNQNFKKKNHIHLNWSFPFFF